MSGGGRAANSDGALLFTGTACAGGLLLETRALLLGVDVGPVVPMGRADRLG